jgi:hypothetical protein
MSEDLPKDAHGVEYDREMYLANDRYASMVDNEIEIVKATIAKANKELKKQHKKQNKNKNDYTKTKEQTKKNKQGKKSRKRRRRRKKRTKRR